MADVLKDFYFACEDKWYAGLDFLDRHGLPVYKVIDPIDKKIPSFAVFAFLLLLGLAFFFFSFGGLIQGQNVTVQFQVVDEESSPLPNVPIAFSFLGTEITKTSDSEGTIELSVPEGTKINYEVDLDKYEIVKKSVSASANTIEVIQLAELQSDTLTKTIKLVNEVGQPILGSAELDFTCATAYGTPPSGISGTGGTFTVTPNADCIPLSVTIHAEGFEDVQSYPLTADKDVYSIVLSEKTIKDASIVVTVKDSQNKTVSGLDVSVQSGGIIVDNALSDSLGTASFSVGSGDYVIVVSDPVNGLYTSVQQSTFVASGETATLTITVSKNAAATMQITVTDKSNKPLKDATVKLKQGTTILQSVVTDVDGKASLPIGDKTQTYTVSASKEGFIPQQQSTSGNQASLTFALEKATGANTAKLTVMVTDQDDEPVADAKVILYDADTGFLSPYDAILSDVNGVATFKNVVSGNYKPFAYKASLKGFGTEQFFDITDPDTYAYTLKLEIPDGVVQVHVVDQDGQPVPFAKVSVYNAFKSTLLGSDLTDTNGTYILPSNGQKSKADKDVYLLVTKSGYAAVTTIQKPILPDTTQLFEVILPPTKPTGNILIELQGLYTEDGKIVTGVGKGKDYIAKFKVEIPEEHDDLDELTVHVRTGDKDIVEKDNWYISSINFPKTSVVKGSSWDPANGVNVDGETITNGNAKWVNAILKGPNPGVYEFEVKVSVRNTAEPQEILKMFYKVMGEDGEILRDPTDANPIDELYAATKAATYQVGVTTTCDDQFCFDASIFDIKEGLIEDVTDQFNAQVFKEYRLTFNLLNNGSEFHTNSNLRVEASSEGLDFTTYELYNADAQLIKGVVNASEFKNPIPMGSFTPQKKIGGSIVFKPKEIGTTIITLQLISDFKPVFSKDIIINITGDKTMTVTVIPDTFPSNVPITLQIHAEDAATGDEIKEALVSLENNLGIVLATKLTDAAGNAEIELPGQAPGKKITLKVEKENYTPYMQQLVISDKVISISPEVLGININVKTETEKTKQFTITNELGQPIVIKKLLIQGNLKGYLDKEKIESALLPYTNQILNSKSQLQVNLKSVLTPEALELTEHQDIDAVLDIEVESYGNVYAFELPLKYSLAVSSEVDDPTCLVVAPNAWITSTDGQTVTYEFSIQNNCAIGGNPSSLKELKAKANWSGNEIGEVVLSVFEQNNPTAIGAAKVRSGYFSNVLPTLPAQDNLIARLDFTPYGGIKGDGTFDVEIQATNPLEGKPQVLSGKVHAKITVVNLADCIVYDKEILDLQPGKKDQLTIETKGCGAPVEFSLQSDLDIPSKTFTLQGNDKKTMEIGDNELDQGQYPIYVNVEGNENKVPSQNKIIRARINDPNACLQLNRYEFDVYDDPKNDNDGFDTARLDNYCTQQKVKVVVKIEKSFLDSLKDGLIAGLVAGGLNILDNSLQGKDALTGGPKTTTPAAPAKGTTTTGTAASGTGATTPPATAPQKFTADGDEIFTDEQGNEYFYGSWFASLVDNKTYVIKPTTSTPTVGSNNSSTPYTPSPIPNPAPSTTPTTGTPPAKDLAPRSLPVSGLFVLLQGKTPGAVSQDGNPGAGPQVGANNTTSTVTAAGQSGLGQALNSIIGITSLGTGNPLVSFAVTTIVYTLIDYWTSEDKEFDATVVAKDLVLDDVLIIGGEKGADEDTEDADIKVKKEGSAVLPKISQEKAVVGKVDALNLTFTNISQFVNQSIFRNLLVTGERFIFKDGAKYDDEIPKEKELKIDKKDDAKVRFHLQFNSFTPESLAKAQTPPIALDCDTFSEKTGKTGPDAAPKIAFEWNFTDISPYSCDDGQVDAEGKPSHIYCDVTQFSIELLQKVQLLRQFVEANAPFSCPLEDQLAGIKTQPIPAADIGISSLAADKVGTKDVNMVVGIENKTPVANLVKLTVSYKLKDATTAPVTLNKDVNVPVGGSKVSIGFVVNNLAEGHYVLDASIVPSKCEDCSDSVPASNILSTEFFIGQANSLVDCEPFTTTRLQEFIAASEAAGKSLSYPNGLDKDELLQLVNFRAHLMQDRFSPDFYTDFDRYATKVSFFDAPTYYLNEADGLKHFFKDRQHWVVKREGSDPAPEGYILPGPGIYDVTLDINFDTQDMKFFKNGEPDAVVNILVEKTNTTEDTSPFYSMPFNGLVGTDDGQGRVGYGVNFSGEKIVVNDEASAQLTTTDIPDSTPVASVQTSKTDAYTILNSTERGDVLTVTKNASNALSVKWSPSFATPVLMKIGGNHAQSDVYAYYSVGVNNDTSQSYIGVQGNPWYGVGPNCRDFSDKSLFDSYNRKYDTSAINADCALVGPQENTSYGFEWCENTIHTGNVYLKTVFYTPQSGESQISRTAWKDEMSFIGEGITGASIPLVGTNAIPQNSPGDELSSIEDVLNLVSDRAVCVRNTGAKTEFFWNPKEVLNALAAQEKSAEALCIVK